MTNWEPIGITTGNVVVVGHEHSDGSREDFLYAFLAHALDLFVVASFLPSKLG